MATDAAPLISPKTKLDAIPSKEQVEGMSQVLRILINIL